MTHPFLAASLLICMPFMVLSADTVQDKCGLAEPCTLGTRGYHVLPPDNWDGESALPVLMHFHGWMREGSLVVRHQRIASATRKRGVLLVAPNGARKTWNFWTSDTKDVPFAAAVLEQVAQDFPVDQNRIYVSGYSYGSAMAWRYACENGNGVAALLAISGSLRETETCSEAPREVRHVHGLDDTVMDFPMGPNGDTTYPVLLWRDRYECEAGRAGGPWQARSFLTFERTIWDCVGGRVTLDLHPGGHFIPHGWIARQLDDLLDLPPTYP